MDLDHADRLLEGFLTLARAQNGQLDEHHQVSVADLMATVCRALGIDPNRQNMSNVGRPIPLVERGARPVTEVLA